MAALHESGSVVVARTADELYDMVADVTRMGEWSPVCTACWWDSGATPVVGARFTGRNQQADRTWETRSAVVVAKRGHEFAFIVSETGTRWGYQFRPVEGGTQITESWNLTPEVVAVWKQRAGPDAEAQILDRVERTRAEIAATLAAIKKAAEST